MMQGQQGIKANEDEFKRRHLHRIPIQSFMMCLVTRRAEVAELKVGKVLY
jgi:hypothetical protein